MTQSRALIRATALARDLDLSDEGRALLRNDHSPDQFLSALDAHHCYADGLLLLSRWLPIREAVWWACECLWHLNRPMVPRKADEEALRAAVRWVVEPAEKHRRAAEQAAEAAGMDTPAGCIAQAAFWSGGSISAPDLPPVEMPPHAAAEVLVKALILATAGLAAKEQHQHRFLQLGYQVVTGANRWEQHVHAPVQA
jgi:hypothetical protein